VLFSSFPSENIFEPYFVARKFPCLTLSFHLERAMNKIKVLVANRPRLMRELVLATISEQPDIEIVGEVTDIAEIERVVAEPKNELPPTMP
jgi:hypothetical protein